MKFIVLILVMVSIANAEEVQCYWGEKYRGPGFYFNYSQQVTAVVISNYTGKNVLLGCRNIQYKSDGKKGTGSSIMFQLLTPGKVMMDNMVGYSDNDYMIPMPKYEGPKIDGRASDVIKGEVQYTFDGINDIKSLEIGK